MFLRWVFPLCCVLGLSAAQCTSGVGDRLTGSWGGEGAGVVVTSDKAIVSYTCGQTTISGPIAVDGDQRFEATGEHVRVGGAPPRPDVPEERRPAHVGGRVRGDLMSLTVRLADTDQALGTFVLTRGATPSVLLCP